MIELNLLDSSSHVILLRLLVLITIYQHLPYCIKFNLKYQLFIIQLLFIGLFSI
jgi:hypothetical protein